MRKALLEIRKLFLERLYPKRVGDESCVSTGIHIVTSSRSSFHAVNVQTGSVCGLCLLADQFHILCDLGPALKVRDRAPIRRHDLEHLAKLKFPNFLPS